MIIENMPEDLNIDHVIKRVFNRLKRISPQEKWRIEEKSDTKFQSLALLLQPNHNIIENLYILIDYAPVHGESSRSLFRFISGMIPNSPTLKNLIIVPELQHGRTFESTIQEIDFYHSIVEGYPFQNISLSVYPVQKQGEDYKSAFPYKSLGRIPTTLVVG